MSTIIFANARILTLAGADGPRRGDAAADLGVIERGWLRVDDDVITGVGPGDPPPPAAGDRGELLDAAGNVLMPAFVDCHTHACWAGSRTDEWTRRLAGATYLELLAEGGGIMSTVRAVRQASRDRLRDGLERRLARHVALGTGAIEVKSGYGLSTGTELEMLRAIHECSLEVPQPVVGTFLGAHAIDPEQSGFVDRTIEETLPAVAGEFPGITVDAYCEDGAWSLEDCLRLFRAAADLGCPIRVHADQFHELGMVREAIALGATTVDHLEATGPEGLDALAGSATIGVMLPASGFHLDDRYADGRSFLDAGGALALATNHNPGSAPTPSMPFTIALACRKLGLTPPEAIVATTWNAACVLGLQDRLGALAPGLRADVQLLDTEDERDLAFRVGDPGPLLVLLEGDVVHARGVGVDDGADEDGEAT